MITFMRRYRKGLQIGLLVVIVAFVASLFVFGARGMGDGSGGREAVATVNGEQIPVERYQRRYQAYIDAYSQMYQGRFSAEIAERLGLPQQVVNDLVQESLVVQRAKAEGLEVSDEELSAQIQAIQAFHEGGRFSIRRYQELLKQRGMTPSTFEQDVRRELTRLKIENMVKNGVKVSDGEVEQAFKQQREQVRAAWALVDLGPIVSATAVSDGELDAYLKAHETDFRQPERRRIQYVMLIPKDFTKPVADAEVETYYKEHASEFESPRQVRASHVLIRVPETGGSAAEDKAKATIADVIRRAGAGEPFAKLAKEISQDTGTASKGGDLGFIAKGEVLPAFEKVAFELKPGAVSPEPVRTPAGFHAILVTDVREGGKKPLAAVTAQIREKLSAGSADQAARARAEELKSSLQSAPDFMAEARKRGLTPVESKVPRVDARPGAPRQDSVEETVFALTIGGVGGPVKTPAGYVVVKAVEHLPAAVPPLAEIKDQVTAAVKRQKAEAVALERGKQLAASAKAEDLAAAAKKVGATTGETAPFSRAKPAEKLPGDAMLAALETVAGGVTNPVKTPQGVYVLKVLERKPADLGELAAERDKLRGELVTQKQAHVWESWLASARGSAKVDVSPRLLQQRRG
jgi:peptidyl-prolyl cis-trans isomerase D